MVVVTVYNGCLLVKGEKRLFERNWHALSCGPTIRGLRANSRHIQWSHIIHTGLISARRCMLLIWCADLPRQLLLSHIIQSNGQIAENIVLLAASQIALLCFIKLHADIIVILGTPDETSSSRTV